MSDKVIYKAENGIKMLFRSILCLALIIVAFFFISRAPIIFFILLAVGLFQLLFYSYSSISVYADRITYSSKSIVGAMKEVKVIQYADIYEINFSPAEFIDENSVNSGLFTILFPNKKNEVIVSYTNNTNEILRWGGNLLEVQNACEKANTLIARDFNRSKF